MLDPRTKFPHTVGATWGNALATFQNAGFWCATTLLAHHIPAFRGTDWKNQGHWQPVGEFGVSVRGASAKGRSFCWGGGKSPGREKWVASFVTRVGEGATTFLCAEIATWGNSQAPFRKIGNLVHVLPRLAPNTHINNQRPGLLRARPAQRSNSEKKSYRFRPGSTWPQGDCP